jgi:hypothetical protein
MTAGCYRACERWRSSVPDHGQQVAAVRHTNHANGQPCRLPSSPAICAQVVYILDMVRALEREMLKRIHAQGLNMTPSL